MTENGKDDDHGQMKKKKMEMIMMAIMMRSIVRREIVK